VLRFPFEKVWSLPDGRQVCSLMFGVGLPKVKNGNAN